MLLEASLSGYSMSESYITKSDRMRHGLLDTTPRETRTHRLISAMLTERQNAVTSNSLASFGMDGSKNLTSANSSARLPDTPGSEQDIRPGRGSVALPTCVVAPSSNDREYEEMNSELDDGFIPSRKQREFIPESRKDEGYWEKRRKNNEAARRSREKRRIHDMALENRIMDLTRDNCKLRNELIAVKKKFGIPLDEVVTEQSLNSQVPAISPNRNTSHLPQSTLADLQQRCQPSVQQSPTRGRNASGSMRSSQLLNFYQQNPSSHYPLPQVPAEMFSNRNLPEPGSKIYPGKYDAQSSLTMKSMTDESNFPPRRIDDHLRPMYSSSLPPNRAPPYHHSPLPVASPKSYWVPTTELTSSDSNDEGDWNDQVQDQPLSLVKKRPSIENESSSDISNNSSRASTSPPSSVSSALPHKLRHKQTHEYAPSNLSSSGIIQFPNGTPQVSELALSRPSLSATHNDEYALQSPLESYKIRPRSFSNPRSMYDSKYVERRRKNNEAARKCRENRKTLTKIREVKSGFLESENGKLKDELCNLQEEMRELRDLLEKKRQEKDMRPADELDKEGEKIDIKVESMDEDDVTVAKANQEAMEEEVKVKDEY